MTIIYILFAIFFTLVIIDFKKGILLYVPWLLFFGINVRLGPSTFNTMFILAAFVIFYVKRRELVWATFPLKKTFVVYGFLYIITCCIPVFDPQSIFGIVVQVLLISYIYYYCLQTESDIRFAIFSYAVFAIVMCGNGILQPLMGINPLDDFLQSVSVEDKSLFLDNEYIRMGQVRYRSFIPHSISYGVACVVILIPLLWYLVTMPRSNKFLNTFLLIAIPLLFSGIIICGSRTPVLGLLPFAFLFFSSKYLSRKTKFYVSVIAVIFIFVSGDYLLYSVESIFNKKLAEDAGGSDSSMRMMQLTLSFNWLLERPLFGHGMGWDPSLVDWRIMGGESVWFPLMIQNGIVGVFSYVYFLWGIFKLTKKSTGKIFLILLFFSWLIMRTATSLIGVNDAQFLTAFFIIYRYYEIKTIDNNSCLQC